MEVETTLDNPPATASLDTINENVLALIKKFDAIITPVQPEPPAMFLDTVMLSDRKVMVIDTGINIPLLTFQIKDNRKESSGLHGTFGRVLCDILVLSNDFVLAANGEDRSPDLHFTSNIASILETPIFYENGIMAIATLSSRVEGGYITIDCSEHPETKEHIALWLKSIHDSTKIPPLNGL